MKTTYLLPVILAAGLVAGCHTTDSSKPSTAGTSASVGGINTSALVAAFKNADTQTVQVVQDVVAHVSKKDYSNALGSLQKLHSIPGLTAAQADSVNSLISSLSGKAK